MFADPSFWFLVTFVIFFALLGKKLWVLVTAQLDTRAEKIEATIQEAVQLRDDAQHLLEEAQQKHDESAQRAGEIMQRASEEAKKVRKNSSIEIKDFTAKRELQVGERIAYAEQKAVEDIRNQAVELAFTTTERLLQQLVDEKIDDKLIEQALTALENRARTLHH